MYLPRLLRDYGEAGAVNTLLAPWGFVDDETFLTKSGHVGIVYADFGTLALIAERTAEAYEQVGGTIVAENS